MHMKINKISEEVLIMNTELDYAADLGQMIACATVSYKNKPYDDKEFKKLREVI